MTVIYDPEGLPPGWPDVAAVVLVGREREVGGSERQHRPLLPHQPAGHGGELAGLVRGHWGVENGLHWCLDVAFREDANRTAAGHAGANLGLVRRVAASLLKQDPAKGSIKAKRLRAALDEKFLEQVLQGNAGN